METVATGHRHSRARAAVAKRRRNQHPPAAAHTGNRTTKPEAGTNKPTETDGTSRSDAAAATISLPEPLAAAVEVKDASEQSKPALISQKNAPNTPQDIQVKSKHKLKQNNSDESKKIPAQARQMVPPFRSREERLAAGKSLRDKLSRKSCANWKVPGDRRDPIEILEESNKGRVAELVPIRYGRMMRSPFTFLRGSSALMAYDLAAMPNTGIRVQACGDCHLLNFGVFATPERQLVFDINDFDETLPAPWEWDVLRLAASFVVSGRDCRLTGKESRTAAETCVRSYREHLRQYTQMSPLEVWYSRLDEQTLIGMAGDTAGRKFRERLAQKARQNVAEHVFPKIVAMVGGRHRLVDQPPVLFHVAEPDFEARLKEGVEDYRNSLSDERRALLDRYRLDDFAVKVVGIGSVGTRCYIALAFSEDNQPLILQVKEARASVLEPYAGNSQYENQGQRVVMGQRLMQSSSDIFLGWVRGRYGNDFYVRQFRDMKMSVPVEGFTAVQLNRYAEICGWTLARSHAKSTNVAAISGYLGNSGDFDQAVGAFAVAYADQTERDHAALVKAVRSGRLEAFSEDVS